MASDVFAALGDPTRRHILGRLASGGPSTATGLAGELDISRQAVAKHLAILADAGVARGRRVGRETRFAVDLAALDEVTTWVAHLESAWTARLDGLSASVRDARS